MHCGFCNATCPKGLEYLLRDELVALGAEDVREALAGVHFAGTLETAYRACLWSRLASRVLLPLAEFDAATDDALYSGVQAIDWSKHLGPRATLAVDANSAQSKLTHSQFIAQRVKDAIVDQFRQRDGSRPDVDTDEPDVRINLRLRRDRATLSIDLAGAPLHRRGWRELQGEAPLKENLAAAPRDATCEADSPASCSSLRRRPLHRIRAIQASAQSIVAGKLTQRLPLSGRRT